MVNKLTKNYKLASDCFSKFYSLRTFFPFIFLICLKLKNQILKENADYLKKTVNKAKPLEPATKTMIFRMLFTLGLLSKHFDIEGEEFNEYKVNPSCRRILLTSYFLTNCFSCFQLCTKQELFSLFLFFIKGFEVEVQHKALIGLGSFLARYSEFMIKDEIKTLYHAYIKNANVPITLKSQVNTPTEISKIKATSTFYLSFFPL